MSTGETLLLIGAIIIFSLAALYLNQAALDGTRALTETALLNAATAAGLSYIENAKNLAFDEATIESPELDDPGLLTQPGDFGAEPGEAVSSVDDIDDYQDFSDSVITNVAPYYITAKIVYIDSSNMNISVTDPTFYKQMTVYVFTPFLKDTVRLRHIFTHWK